MKTFTKIMAVVLSLALTAAMSVGLTVAYLQDDDSDVNVMTLGNVTIEQHEYERVVENGTYKTATIDGKTSYVLKDFMQNKPLMPIVGDPSLPGDHSGYAGYDAIPVRMSQVGSYGGMDVFAGKNAQDKFVTVENTGKSDAYVRTLVAVECGEADSGLIGTSYHGTWTQYKLGKIVIEGNNYYVYEYVYAGGQLSNGTWRHENGILPAGDTSYPNLSQVYIKSAAQNEDMIKIDGNKNGKLDILVLSQAIQTNGFDTATAAFDAGFPKGDNNENVAAWFGGVIAGSVDLWEGTVDTSFIDPNEIANATPENPVTVTIETAEEFAGFVKLANTNTFKNVTIKLEKDIDLAGQNWNEGGAIAAYGPAFNGTLDGNGHTIYNLSAQNNWTYANALFRTIGNDACIKNLTIEDANIANAAASSKNKEYGILVGIVGGGTLTIENVTIRNSSVSCKTSAGILVGGMTEGAIVCKNVTMENCHVNVTSASGKGGAILGYGWSSHDYDYAGIYTDDVQLINCTYTVAGVQQAELPLYNYVK